MTRNNIRSSLLLALSLGGCAYSTELKSGSRPGSPELPRPFNSAVVLRSSDIKEQIDIGGPSGPLGNFTESIRDALIECKAFSNVYVPRDGYTPSERDIVLDLKVVRRTKADAAANKSKAFGVWFGLFIPAAFLDFTGTQTIETTPKTTGGLPFGDTVVTEGRMSWMYFTEPYAAGVDAVKSILPTHAKEVAMVIVEAAARSAR